MAETVINSAAIPTQMRGLANIPALKKDIDLVLWAKRFPIWVVIIAAKVMDVAA
jgi:hypothetical protein